MEQREDRNNWLTGDWRRNWREKTLFQALEAALLAL